MAFRSFSLSSLLVSQPSWSESDFPPTTRTSSGVPFSVPGLRRFLPHPQRTTTIQCSDSNSRRSTRSSRHLDRDHSPFPPFPPTYPDNSHHNSHSDPSPAVSFSNPFQRNNPTTETAAQVIEFPPPLHALSTTQPPSPTTLGTTPFAAISETEHAPAAGEYLPPPVDQISTPSTTSSPRSRSEARTRTSSVFSTVDHLPRGDITADVMAPSITDGSATMTARPVSTALSGLAPMTATTSSSILSARRSTEPAISPSLSTAKHDSKPTIRFFAYQDSQHSSRPSLPFAPMNRTLPSETSIIRVGRYSERDGIPLASPSGPSDAPIGFKSKVVSRRHCEFSFANGQWHIKDVGSSSGTFLNRIRLSSPNMVSRLYPVRDGDIVQLGIDFRGGEEMIFRCVRIRIECNRSWQQRPNEFNKNTETLIQNLGKGDSVDFAGCRECSICLGSVLRPYQCLFMAACAHVWHYKCISRLIHTTEYPMFQCPNCRAWTDLTADVDDSVDYEDDPNAADKVDKTQTPLPETTSEPSNHDLQTSPAEGQVNPTQEIAINIDPPHDSPADIELAAITQELHIDQEDTSVQLSDSTEHSEAAPDESGTGRNAPIVVTPRSTRPTPIEANRGGSALGETDGLSNGEIYEDNPLTPRNESGPLAFDGRAGLL